MEWPVVRFGGFFCTRYFAQCNKSSYLMNLILWDARWRILFLGKQKVYPSANGEHVVGLLFGLGFPRG